MINRNSFRHGASRIGKGSGKKGKGGGVTWDRWTPPSLNKLQGKLPVQPGVDPSDQLAVPVVLIPGEYKDEMGQASDTYLFRFHKYTETKDGRTRYPELPCIRGVDHSPQNCIGCLKVERKEWKDASDTKENVLVNLCHLVNYHEIPWRKQGQIQTKKDSNEPIMIWKECSHSTLERQLWANQNNRTCEGCTQQAKTRVGGRRYLQLGWGNQKQLAQFQEEVLSRKCKKCKTGAIEVALKCGGCNTVLHPITSGGYTIDQIKQLKEDPQCCVNPQCVHANPQNPMMLVSEYDCGYNDDLLGRRPDGAGCAEGVETEPYSIYDVVLWLIRKGEGTESRIHVHKWCPINEYPWQGTQQIVDLESSGVIKEAVPHVFDFDGMFKFDTEKQAKMLRCPDPYAQQTQYGGNYQNMAPQAAPGYPPQQQYQQPQAAPQLPPQAAPQPTHMPPPAPPQPGYAPQAAPPGVAPQAPAPGIAAPYPQAPAAPGMPPAPPRPNWGGGTDGNQ